MLPGIVRVPTLILKQNKAVGSIWSQLQQRTKVHAAGGAEFYGGRSDTKTNYRLIEFPQEKREEGIKKLGYTKYPSAIKYLGSRYFYRPIKSDLLSYYHVRTGAAKKAREYNPDAGVLCEDLVYLGSTQEYTRTTKTIENALYEQTRGFAVQLILEGRGVKVYWEPKAPYLKARLGVGSKVTDLEEYVRRDPAIKFTVNKKGDLMVLEGPCKERVGHIAMRIFTVLKTHVYTGKGAHIAFNVPRRKAVQKKK